MKGIKKLSTFILFLVMFISINKIIVSARISVSPSEATTGLDGVNIWVDTGGVSNKVKFTGSSSFPAISSMWGMPGNGTQTFLALGIWYLHVYNNNTGEKQTFGPYIREVAPPNRPTVSTSKSNWTNSNVTINVASNGDNGSTGYDTDNNIYSTYVAGVYKSQYHYENEGWVDFVGSFTETREGWRNIYARTIDKVGNISEESVASFGIDKTNPNAIFSPDSSAWTYNNINVVITPSDSGGSGVKQWRYRTSSDNGSTWGNWSGYLANSPSNVTLSIEGQNKIQAEVSDNAGNTTIITSGTYQIDKTKPSGTFSPNSSEVSILDLTTKFTPSDSGGSGVKSWKYRISTDDGANWGGWNQVSNSASKDIYLSTIARCKIEAEVTDDAGNINTIKSGTYNIVNPEPVNGKLEMKKYDFQEYNDTNNNGKKDAGEELKEIYWVKPESEFGIYTDGYIPSNYNIFPTTTYVLYAKDGVFDLSNSPRQYADEYGQSTFGSDYNKYFYSIGWEPATFKKQDDKNYISNTHLAQVKDDRYGKIDKFKLYYTNTYWFKDKEYYDKYVDSGKWLNIDGIPPTGNGLVEIDYKTLNMTITANDIKDDGSGVGSVWAMIFPYDSYSDYNADIDDFQGTSEYKNDEVMERKLNRKANGEYSLTLNAYDDAFKSEMVKVVICAKDNVGNKSIIKEENIDLFTLKARIVPLNNMDYSSTNPPTLEEGQAAVLIMEVTGEVESLDIEFPYKLYDMDNTLDKTITLDQLEKYKRVDNNFIVPLYCENGRYTVEVVAHRKGKERYASPEFIVSDSVLNGIKTRVR